MKVEERLVAYGHENVRATNKTTFELTKEHYLTRKGNCIIAVSASKSLPDLSTKFRETMKKDGAKLHITLEIADMTEVITAMGDHRLILTHPTDMVVRRSDFICNRTLAVHADKAACDVATELVARLKDPRQKVNVKLTVDF